MTLTYKLDLDIYAKGNFLRKLSSGHTHRPDHLLYAATKVISNNFRNFLKGQAHEPWIHHWSLANNGGADNAGQDTR